jgi:hypothetical protein
MKVGQPLLPHGAPNAWDRALVNALVDYLRQVANKLSALSTGAFSAVDNASATLPTSGEYSAGDYVAKSGPVVAGTAGSRYVVYGWLRITNGAAHVLNTDWVEDRRSTGT